MAKQLQDNLLDGMDQPCWSSSKVCSFEKNYIGNAEVTRYAGFVEICWRKAWFYLDFLSREISRLVLLLESKEHVAAEFKRFSLETTTQIV
jgi:hypothetical protein